MTADFSRVRMNPLASFSGVELQQGRVLLDADYNEQVAIVDRRLRALASDVLGRATVSQTTPDAFELSLGGGGLSIGKGRMYVDGLLAENFGIPSATPPLFDPLLSELVHAQAPTYATQLWLQPPPALPTGGRHLVYLDVWEREVTPAENPRLVEPALGVDTTTRRQVVWQVRVLADNAPAGVTCETPDASVPDWANVIAPSTGRLTTGTFDVTASPDPCELPPTGGYTGLENQLYRVEVHDAGQPGAGATFKWSRDNASVASRVATIVSATELELDSLGRDDVLRFAVGHWVEVTDDRREMTQLAGEMRKIADIDEANRRIRFTPALPAAMLPAVLPSSTHPQTSNLRVKRWDQAGEIVRTGPGGTVVVVQDLDAPGSTGVIAIPGPGTTLLLENGVTVVFSSVGPKGFRAGDAWVFAARTADASVEPLAAAAPCSIHHHYARLGFWDIAAGTVSDCRGDWPPVADGHDCSCTACVTEEGHASGRFTIQDAINQVREAGGGTVCIGIGNFALAAPLNMTGVVSMRVKGQGAASVLVAPGAVFDIRNALAVAVQDLTLLSTGSASAIVVSNVLGLALEQLLVAVVSAGDNAGAAIALAGAVMAARIENNLLLAPIGIRALEPRVEGTSTVLLSAGLAIEDNILWCDRNAVLLEGPVLHVLETRVAGNQVLGCRLPALALLGYAAPGSAVRIERNLVQSTGSAVQCSTDGLWIGENKLSASGGAAGIVGIELRPGLDKDGADQCQILANQIAGYSEAGILVRSQVRALIIKLNIIESCGNGIVMLDDAEGASVAIENNQLREIGPAGNPNVPVTAVGIGLSRVDTATIAGNTMHRIGAATGNATLRAGVMALATSRLRVNGNDVVELGPTADFAGSAIGVYLAGPYLQLDVQDNRIERDALPNETPGRANWVALFAARASTPAGAAGTGAVAPQRFGRFAIVPFENNATLMLNGTKGYVAAGFAAGGAAAVRGNTFSARSSAPLVALRAERECLFSENRCDHRAEGGVVAIALQTGMAIVSTNRVSNLTDVAISIETAKTIVAIGNVTTGIIQPALPTQFAPLNLRA
jgi:hypothetical protein